MAKRLLTLRKDNPDEEVRIVCVEETVNNFWGRPLIEVGRTVITRYPKEDWEVLSEEIR